MATVSTREAAKQLAATYGYDVTSRLVRDWYKAGKLAGVQTPSGRIRIYEFAIARLTGEAA